MEPPTPLLHAPTDRASSNDAAIVSRSVHEAAAFDAIYRRHVRAIFAYVAARVGPQHAEDVVAEVFATAFTRRASFDLSASSARPWLYGIAVNKLHQHRDAERRWLEQPTVNDGDDRVGVDDLPAQLDARAAVPELVVALAGLTPAERDVLVLHVFEELTHREIAAVLGIRRGTAKVRLHRGRERLRTALHDDGGDLR